MSSDHYPFSLTLERLSGKGVRYGTVIDVGCADGQFFLDHMHLFPGAVPLNVDAASLYEDSLKAIKAAVGGDYRIAAVTDRVGTIEIVESVHPYWSSLRPAGDPYWSRINDLAKSKVEVPATTLDTLVEELTLEPPFLLKLDVQGAEAAALRGARGMLAHTDVVICEADIDDFRALDTLLAEHGFVLYDVTALARLKDGTLGWFYPVYVSQRLEAVRPRAFWGAEDNDAVIGAQAARREHILKSNAKKLNRLRFAGSTVGRNEPCPCGSGERFKHCCGAHS